MIQDMLLMGDIESVNLFPWQPSLGTIVLGVQCVGHHAPDYVQVATHNIILSQESMRLS